MSELPITREDGYLPILKLKEGELRALSDLGADVKGQMTPLFEMVPAGDTHAPPDHADRRMGRLAKVWEMDLPVMIDLGLQLQYDGLDPITVHEHAANAAEEHGLNIIPVVRPSDEPPFSDAATTLISERDLGAVAIRVRLEDLLVDLSDACAWIIARAGLTPGEAHVVVDLEDNVDPLRAQRLLERIPHIENWGSVTLAAGAFARPEVHGLERVSRDDWRTWNDLDLGRERVGGRHVTFGDYGTLRTEYQDFSDVPAGAMRVPVRLVYTGEQNWLHISRKYDQTMGWDAIYDVCRQLVEQPEWRGRDYSPGDEAIHERAQGGGSTGGPTEWIRWGVAHHFTLVTRSLASRSSS